MTIQPYQSKEESAVEVWVALEEAGDQGLTLIELQEHTGLTRSQVKAGIAEVNHIKQLSEEQPIMVRTKDWCYVLPETYQELLPWTINRLGDMMTRLQTERTRLGAAKGRWPKTIPRHIGTLVDRLIEDLGELVRSTQESA